MLVPVLQLPPPISQVLVSVLQYWSEVLVLSNSYPHFITSTGPCPKITSPISQVLAGSTVTSTISQELDPVLKLPPLYHKYQSLSYRYLPCITRTGHCPTAKPTISLVLYPNLPVPPLYHKHCPCPTDTSPLSQALVPVLQIPPLYHKLWSLSYKYLPFITSSGPCPTDTSPLSQALVPVLQIPPLYHKLWSLSYRYLPYITSSGPCPTETSPLSQVLVVVLPLLP